MSTKKVYFGLIGVLVLLVIGAGAALFLGNAMLQSKSSKLVELKLENRVLEEQQVALKQANKDIEKYAELETITKNIVPQDKDQAKSVREIIQIANESGINIASITFPTSTLGAAQPKPAPAADTGGTETPKPAAPAAPPVTQVKPVSGINGVYELEITIQSDANQPTTYASLINFLTKLEQNRRTAQVAQINIQPKPDDIQSLTFSIVINVFIKP